MVQRADRQNLLARFVPQIGFSNSFFWPILIQHSYRRWEIEVGEVRHKCRHLLFLVASQNIKTLTQTNIPLILIIGAPRKVNLTLGNPKPPITSLHNYITLCPLESPFLCSQSHIVGIDVTQTIQGHLSSRQGFGFR